MVTARTLSRIFPLTALIAVSLVVASCGSSKKTVAPPVAAAAVIGVPIAQATADGHAAATAALAYVAADARGAGKKTCKLVTTQLRASLNTGGKCSVTLSHAPIAQAETAVTRVAVTGTTATAVLPDPGLPPRQVVLLKESGRWLVSNGGS